MSKYKTGNPLGSTAAKDLYDNAQNLDELLNNRQLEFYPDRLGVGRKTYYGIEVSAEEAIKNIGWQELGDWATGITLDTRADIVYYGGNWYKYLGVLPHTIAGNSPTNDGGVWSSSNTNGVWANIGDAALRSEMALTTGFGRIGQVASYADLKLIVPQIAGQHILLESHGGRSGWAALAKPPQGGGPFVAMNGSGVEDGGSIAVVNSIWYWQRIIEEYYTPEMFGSPGDYSSDSSPAIAKAIAAANISGVCYVKCPNKYLLNTPITIPTGLRDSRTKGLDPMFGFTLHLNEVSANADTWDAVPEKWWDATPAFRPASGLENLDFDIKRFDGGGKATCFSTVKASLSTSKISIGLMRNHVIGFRNWGPVSGQGTMNYIHGKNWQGGYQAVLLGSGAGGQQSECHNVDIQWMAEHRFGGIMLQDRTQYSHIRAGTTDFNGEWMSRITLTNISSDTGTEVEFGNPISNGTITRYAMSPVMNNQGTAINGAGGKDIFIAETSNRKNGTSDFAVGQTLSYNGWSATIAAIETCTNAAPYRYYDIIIGNRSGDFSKCQVSSSYAGGVHGHNLHTNDSRTNNSTTTVEALNLKGLGIATDYTTMALYVKNILGYVPFAAVRKDGITWNLPHIMAGQQINGSVNQVNAVNGTPIVIAGFGGSASDLTPDVYEIFVASSQPGTEGLAMVTVTTTQCRIAVSNAAALGFAVDPNNPLQITAVTSGTDAILTAHITKR